MPLQPVAAAVETVQPPAHKRFFARRGVLIGLVIALVVVLGGGYFVVRALLPCTPEKSDSGPTCVALPPNTHFIKMSDDHTWVYTVGNTTIDQVVSFFQTELPKQGWHCFDATNINSLTVNGVRLSGKAVLAGATLGKSDVSITVASDELAKFSFGVSPLPGDVGLGLSLEPHQSGTPSDSSCK